MSATLTGKEIRDLAEAAGFEISDRTKDDEDLLNDEYVIQHCPKDGIRGDDEGIKYYAHIAYCLNCPEEGCHPLGDEIEVYIV